MSESASSSLKSGTQGDSGSLEDWCEFSSSNVVSTKSSVVNMALVPGVSLSSKLSVSSVVPNASSGIQKHKFEYRVLTKTLTIYIIFK
jgi:hypothetical protein